MIVNGTSAVLVCCFLPGGGLPSGILTSGMLSCGIRVVGTGARVARRGGDVGDPHPTLGVAGDELDLADVGQVHAGGARRVHQQGLRPELGQEPLLEQRLEDSATDRVEHGRGAEAVGDPHPEVDRPLRASTMVRSSSRSAVRSSGVVHCRPPIAPTFVQDISKNCGPVFARRPPSSAG